VREDPSVPKLSHARIFDNIMRSGTLDIQETDDPRVKRLYKDESFKVYNFFRDEFFGIEKTVAQIVRYFHSASLKGEESRQVLYLMGPVGSGKSPPVDPNNQDTSVLIGSEDISKLDMYSEGDPRVLDLNGAINVGNRGMCEFIEVFKNETEYLHAMITATQEKVIPAPGRHGLVYV